MCCKRVITVTTNVDKIEGLNAEKYTKRCPHSHLRLLSCIHRQIPEGIHKTERINGTQTCPTRRTIAKVERSGQCSSATSSSSASSSVLRGCDARAVCVWGVPLSRRFSLRNNLVSIGDTVTFVTFEFLFTTSPASLPRGARSSSDRSDEWCSLLESDSSVAGHDSNSLMLRLSSS